MHSSLRPGKIPATPDSVERARSSPGPAGHEGLPMEIPAQYLQFYAALLRRGSFQPGRTKWQV